MMNLRHPCRPPETPHPVPLLMQPDLREERKYSRIAPAKHVA